VGEIRVMRGQMVRHPRETGRGRGLAAKVVQSRVCRRSSVLCCPFLVFRKVGQTSHLVLHSRTPNSSSLGSPCTPMHPRPHFLRSHIPRPTFVSCGVVETTDEGAQAGWAKIESTYKASSAFRKGKLTAEALAKRMVLVSPTADLARLGTADMTVEAVFENMGAYGARCTMCGGALVCGRVFGA